MSAAEPPEPAGRFLWLPRGTRPPVPVPRRQETVLLLVGATYYFSGYDLYVGALALPQIQHSLGIAENAIGPTLSWFRLAALPALLIAVSADVLGRRRALLFTGFFAVIMTVGSAFAQTRGDFIGLQTLARVFTYSEEILCVVIIAEEIDERVRGWASGILATIGASGAGLAIVLFAAVNVLPFGWRAMYAVGGAALLSLALSRRWLRETRRFERRRKEIEQAGSTLRAMANLLIQLRCEYPGRLAALMLAAGAFGFAAGPSTALMSKYLQQTHGYSPPQVTVFYVAIGLISLGASFVAGRLSDRIGRRTVALGTIALSGVGFAGFYSGRVGALFPASAMIALGALSGDSLLSGYAAEIFPTAYRATASGVRFAVAALGTGLGLFLEGRLYDSFGAHGPAISILLAALPLALIAILLLPEPALRRLEDIAPTRSSEPLPQASA